MTFLKDLLATFLTGVGIGLGCGVVLAVWNVLSLV